MIYNAARVRSFPTKLQVDTCKSKEDRSAPSMIYTVAHLVIEIQAMIYNVARVRRLFTKYQVDTCKTKERYICACAVAHLAVEIQDMIYNVARVRRLSTKFQVDTCKSKEDNLRKIVHPSHDLCMRSCAYMLDLRS